MQEDAYRECAFALEESVADILDGRRAMDPNDAKDYLYFNHRLQRYLGSSAYFKQVVLAHRNPLLDSEILDFIARILAVPLNWSMGPCGKLSISGYFLGEYSRRFLAQ
jgi:hypothetical protein